MLLYLFFLISFLVFGSFIIGPLTLRVWAVMLIVIYLIFSAAKNKVYKKNVYITLFVVYILFLFLAQIMNGDVESYGVKWLFANHFVCIVAFISTVFVLRTNTQNRIGIIIYTVMGLLVLDSIVTIMQYGNSPIGWAINMVIMQGRNELVMASEESYQSLETLAGFAKVPGIFDSAVENGLFLGSCGILPFYVINRESFLPKIVSAAVIILSLVACFMCQERAAMLVLLASLLFLCLKTFKKKSVWLLFGIIIVFLLFNNFFSNIDFGRYEKVGLFSNDARKDIWNYYWSYISDNWLWGGADHFRKITGTLPHNFFFNAFAFSGLLGGCIVITLFVMLIMKSFKLVFSNKTSSITRVVAISLLAILAQSLVHNASIITGDVLTFLLFGLMVASEGIKNTNYRIKK